MAGNIINLEDLVPGLAGKTFRLPAGVEADGKTTKYDDYHVPGDLESEVVFEFLALFEDMVTFQERANTLKAEAEENPDTANARLAEVLDALKALNDTVKAKLLVVFQIASPELEKLPFGSATTMTVLSEILDMMGLTQPALPMPPEGGADPQNRAARRARTSKKTTTTSTKKAGRRAARAGK